METLHPREVELGLARVGRVGKRLFPGPPPFRVVTVAGTNGKGSTVAMLEAVLQRAGYRTGAYTSPHLLRYNERVRIGGREADDAALCRAFEQVEAARGDISLSYFEFGTLAAIQMFREAGVQVALLEVGLGGRLDAVNILDPDVAVVSSIGIDHTEWLGGTREDIGREKAGIFRAGRPAVCADPEPPASIAAQARAVGARLYQLGRDFHVETQDPGWTWRFHDRVRSGLPHPLLRGEEQLCNAAAVLTVLHILAPDFPVASQHIRDGLSAADLPGRFQVLPGAPVCVLDVAHNPQAVARLRLKLMQQAVSGRTLALAGMLRDKALVENLRLLADRVDAWFFTTLPAGRGAGGAELMAAAREAGITAPMKAYEEPLPAWQALRAEARPDDRMLVFGSFYLVGDILRAHQQGTP